MRALMVLLRSFAALTAIGFAGQAFGAADPADLERCAYIDDTEAGNAYANAPVKLRFSDMEKDLSGPEAQNINIMVNDFWRAMTAQEAAASDWMDHPEVEITASDRTCTFPAMLVVEDQYFANAATGKYVTNRLARCAYFGVDPSSDLYMTNIHDPAIEQWNAPGPAFISYVSCQFIANLLPRLEVEGTTETNFVAEEVPDELPAPDVRNPGPFPSPEMVPENLQLIGSSVTTYEPFEVILLREAGG